jgi:hypothetical protein
LVDAYGQRQAEKILASMARALQNALGGRVVFAGIRETLPMFIVESDNVTLWNLRRVVDRAAREVEQQTGVPLRILARALDLQNAARTDLAAYYEDAPYVPFEITERTRRGNGVSSTPFARVMGQWVQAQTDWEAPARGRLNERDGRTVQTTPAVPSGARALPAPGLTVPTMDRVRALLGVSVTRNDLEDYLAYLDQVSRASNGNLPVGFVIPPQEAMNLSALNGEQQVQLFRAFTTLFPPGQEESLQPLRDAANGRWMRRILGRDSRSGGDGRSSFRFNPGMERDLDRLGIGSRVRYGHLGVVEGASLNANL